MKTEVIDVSPTRKEIKIEIETDAVRAAYDSVSDRYMKLAKVPGFRPGHAPRSVVRTRFKEEIRSEVLRELVPQALQDAIEEKQLQVIGDPDVHLDDAEGKGKLGEEPLKVHVHVEVLPEVTLGEYKGLEAKRMVRPVGDEDVERVIEGLREASAALQPVEDRGAELGDTVTVNFNGKFAETPEAEDINVDEVDVELGGAGVQQEFTDNLLGVRADEERKFTVAYPEDFTSKGLAGKTLDYTATVTAVRIKVMPELDDEWAKSMGDEFESLADLRAKVKENLTERAVFESENRVRSEVMGKLVDAHQFEVPQTLLEHQTRQNMESVVRNMLSQGVDPRGQEMDWAGMQAQLQVQSAFDLRGSLLLERIADQEQIEVSNEEIESEIAAHAESSRQSVEQVRAALTKQGGERSIADRLRNRKALDLLVENARVTDAEWQEEIDAATDENAATETTEAPANDAPAATSITEDGDEAKAQSSSSSET